MASVPHFQHAEDHRAPEPRLRLKPKGSLAGYVDGGWWPESRDLVVELPGLVRVLGERLGRVTRVVFPVAAWDNAPWRITVDGRMIRLEGAHHQDECVVNVCGPDRRRITLLVIPRDTTTIVSHDAMMAASGQDNVDLPADILTAAGAATGTATTRLRLLSQDRVHWAADGSLVRESDRPAGTPDKSPHRTVEMKSLPHNISTTNSPPRTGG
jgi:hypothetical protein